MLIKVDCEKIRETMLNEAKTDIKQIKDGVCLTVIQVGDDKASSTYVKNKERTCKLVGIKNKTIKLPETSTFEDVQMEIEKCNADDSIHGILLQLPLPKALDKHTRELIDTISPQKDVDGLTTTNIGKLWSGQSLDELLTPCTPTGILKVLEPINLDGQNICIIGRSNLVGKPLVAILERLNATVTLCHSKSTDVFQKIWQNDIIISSIGKPKYWDCNMFDEKIIIDVGINRDENGKLCGDVNWDNPDDKLDVIYTSVPKGVGLLTTSQLMLNTIKAYKLGKL